MELAPEICFRASRARDARFDGRFFVGIRSTRIYCRPVCTARAARRENQRYFASAAAAEDAGFRPCLLCRPELAPGLASIDAAHQLAQAAASRIDDGLAGEGGLDAVANALGVTGRHLRRVFEAEYGVTPIAYAQTARLLLAKRLLTDTALPVTEVALAAGFRSVRRFNALFSARYRMQPTALRRAAATSAVDHHRFVLATRAPFDYPRLLRFHAERAIEGVERADERTLRRTLRVVADGKSLAGWIEVRQAARGVGVELHVDARLTAVLPRVLAACKRAFDLDCQPQAVSSALGELAAPRPGLRLPGAFDGFETAVRAILGQQVTVRGASTLARRLVQQFGTPIETPFAGVDKLFPDAAQLAQCKPAQIARLGIIAARARAVIALARAVADGSIGLEPTAPLEATLQRLRELPGIGAWTAQMIALRALHWPDAFPAADIGVMNALKERNVTRIAQIAEQWRPWRGYALIHLWSALEDR